MRERVRETSSPCAASGWRIVIAAVLTVAATFAAKPAAAATADLSVQLTATPDPVLSSRNITYSATVTAAARTRRCCW